MTLGAPARRLADVAASRGAGTPENLLDTLLVRLVQAVAGSLRERGLPVAHETPAVPQRRGAASGAATAGADEVMSFEFDVPGEKLTLVVGVTDSDEAIVAAAPPRARVADVA